MSALLNSNDPKSRAIVGRVRDERILPLFAKWLGPPDAAARAAQMLLLSTAFHLFVRLMRDGQHDPDTADKTAQWFAETLQAIVDK